MTLQIDADTLARRIAVLDEIGVGPLWMRRSLMLDAMSVSESPVSVPSAAPATTSAPAASSSSPSSSSSFETATTAGSAKSPIDDAAWDDGALHAGAAAPVKTVLTLCTGADVADPTRYLFVARASSVQGSEELFDNILLALGLRKEAGAQGKLADLQAQAAAHRPSVLIAMGPAIALALIDDGQGDSRDKSQTAGNENARFEALRGRLHRSGERPLLVTYDATHLLRNPIDKRGAWDDLCLLTGLQAADVADPA
jgi:hypothetical protein